MRGAFLPFAVAVGAFFVGACNLFFGSPTTGEFRDAEALDVEASSNEADGAGTSLDGDADETGDASQGEVDANAEVDADLDAPACVTAPAYVVSPSSGLSCGADASWEAPTHVCVADGGYTESLQTTPAKCASWCQFTCACLADAGICGTKAMVTCYAGGPGIPIQSLECN